MDRVYQKTEGKAIEQELASIRITDKKEDTSVKYPFDEVPVRRAANIILEYDIREDILYRYYRMRQPDGRNYKKLGIRKFRECNKGTLFFQPEDWETFEENFCEGSCIPADVRFREGWEQEYSWYHAVFKTFFKEKKLEKVRCFLEDVNKPKPYSCNEKDDKARESLIKSIGRKIQSSMNAIISTSDMLLAEQISGETTEKLKTIRNISISLNKIVGDALDFTKIISDGFHLLPSDYCMSSLLLDMVNFVMVQLKDRNIRFFLDLDASVPEHLYGDVTRIAQILMNILCNAMEFTSSGYIVLKTGGHTQEEDKYFLEISVMDSGVGMKDEKVSSFMEADNELVFAGSLGRTQGLGIPISRNLARLMGGDITVKSEWGQGSIFHITLIQEMKKQIPVMQTVAAQVNILVLEPEPLVEKHIVWLLEQLKVNHMVFGNLKEAVDTEGCTHVLLRSGILLPDRKELEKRFGREHIILLTEQDEFSDITLMRYRQIPVPLICLHLPKLLNSYDSKKNACIYMNKRKFPPHTGSILIVDDSPVNLEMTRSVLETYLLNVDMADSGEKAVELVQKNEYDLVFMDQMMPGMNGTETLSCIRKLGGRYKNLPVIALTAAVNIGIREELLHAGFQDYLVKPLEVLEVNRILDTYVNPEHTNENMIGEEIMELDYPGLDLVGRLRAACRSMEYDCAEQIVHEMLRYTYPSEITEHLNAMLESCEEFAYDEFDKQVDELLNGCR